MLVFLEAFCQCFFALVEITFSEMNFKIKLVCKFNSLGGKSCGGKIGDLLAMSYGVKTIFHWDGKKGK